MIRILKIQVDYSEEMHHDSLMRNQNLQACFSIMNSLGFNGEFNPRSFQSKIANVNLNLRGVVILITLSSNTPVTVRERMSPLDEHGMTITKSFLLTSRFNDYFRGCSGTGRLCQVVS